MPAKYTCATCGATFLDYPSRRRRFCSEACRKTPPHHPLAERLWAQVTKSDDCWLWIGGTTTAGYGLISKDGGAYSGRFYTHRVAWELAAGPVPEGMAVCHTCDIPGCVRNDEVGTYEVNGILHPRRGHLWLGTDADNADDKVRKGRAPMGDGVGLRLHPESVLRGERSPTAKLTDVAVRSIRLRYAAGGITQQRLAEEYGVTNSLICTVISGKKWKHVT